MKTARRSAAARALALALSAIAASACASAPPLTLEDAETLHAERDEWRGDRSGAVLLRHHVETWIATAAPDPARAEARVSVRWVLARYAGSPAVETLTVDAPPGARLTALRARVLAPAGEAAAAPLAVREAAAADAVDPDRRAFALDFAPLAPGALLEVAATLAVPGTLTADARWLAHPALPTAELLLSWSVPDDATASLDLLAPSAPLPARPVATTAGGRVVHGLYLRALPPRAAPAAHARFVLASARPRGYAQRFASTWRDASAPYVAGLVAPSPALREGYAAPFVPADASPRARAERAYLWVRDRLAAPDALALASRWDAARPLPGPVQDNTLTATDKVHLLHWLLDAAGVEHRLAVARAARWPRLDPARPTPGAFDTPLLHLPALDLWLDPACRACPAGAVRPELAGAQALPLPADSPPLVLP